MLGRSDGMTTRTKDLTLAAALALAAALVLLILAPAAHGGGFSVTTLDPLAATPRAGDTIPVGYTVRAHGVTPVAAAGSGIALTGADGTLAFFPGRPDGPEGHHMAQVRFPSEGAWRWDFAYAGRAERPPYLAQALGTVRVAPATPPPPVTPVASTAAGWPSALAWGLLAGTLAAAALLVAQLVHRRREPRDTPATG